MTISSVDIIKLHHPSIIPIVGCHFPLFILSSICKSACAEVEQYRKSLIRDRGVDGEETRMRRSNVRRSRSSGSTAHLLDKHHIENNK